VAEGREELDHEKYRGSWRVGLNNLQLLPAEENLAKSNRFTAADAAAYAKSVGWMAIAGLEVEWRAQGECACEACVWRMCNVIHKVGSFPPCRMYGHCSSIIPPDIPPYERFPPYERSPPYDRFLPYERCIVSTEDVLYNLLKARSLYHISSFCVFNLFEYIPHRYVPVAPVDAYGTRVVYLADIASCTVERVAIVVSPRLHCDRGELPTLIETHCTRLEPQ
jgi:hypothetical protein